ncbi:MAG: DUF6261 family protein [Bacteroidales bacterium]|jgi:hypothetical protein|nr:DUF6261 family protein [Bacteroidales bacterium]
MKIKKIDLSHLRNDEHFQFYTEFRDMIQNGTPESLKITAQFNAFMTLFGEEDQALHKIMKSALTADIELLDHRRDELFRGMADANLAALNHFTESVRTAARRLQIVFDTYGNVAAKTLNEETSAITNLIQELAGTYLEDTKTVGITDWASALNEANINFERLVKGRYDEDTQRTDLVLRQVRVQLDAAYRTITERIDALMLVEGGEFFEEFIRCLNTIIEKYRNTIAKRQGMKEAEDDE